MNVQQANLYQHIVNSVEGEAPLVIKTVIRPKGVYTSTGPVSVSSRNEDYVLLSAMPTDLQNRIRTAVEALISGRLSRELSWIHPSRKGIRFKIAFRY